MTKVNSEGKKTLSKCKICSHGAAAQEKRLLILCHHQPYIKTVKAHSYDLYHPLV